MTFGRGDTEVADLLIKAGADVNVKTRCVLFLLQSHHLEEVIYIDFNTINHHPEISNHVQFWGERRLLHKRIALHFRVVC